MNKSGVINYAKNSITRLVVRLCFIRNHSYSQTPVKVSDISYFRCKLVVSLSEHSSQFHGNPKVVCASYPSTYFNLLNVLVALS